jgi:Ulp1 family protease
MRRRNEPVTFRHSGTRVIPKYPVTNDDFQRLRPNTWIGDEVINGYGSLIDNSTGPDTIILTSFFIRAIVTEGYSKVSRWLKVSSN